MVTMCRGVSRLDHRDLVPLDKLQQANFHRKFQVNLLVLHALTHKQLQSRHLVVFQRQAQLQVLLVGWWDFRQCIPASMGDLVLLR